MRLAGCEYYTKKPPESFAAAWLVEANEALGKKVVWSMKKSMEALESYGHIW
jgi:hypothetical protein